MTLAPCSLRDFDTGAVVEGGKLEVTLLSLHQREFRLVIFQGRVRFLFCVSGMGTGGYDGQYGRCFKSGGTNAIFGSLKAFDRWMGMQMQVCTAQDRYLLAVAAEDEYDAGG